MVNITMLSALFAYDLKSVAYKPILSANASALMTRPGINLAQGAGGSVAQAPVVAYAADQTSDSAQGSNASDPASTSGGNAAASGSSCTPDPYTAPPIEDQTFAPHDQTTMNVFRYRQQHSVNLGSWCVLACFYISCGSGRW